MIRISDLQQDPTVKTVSFKSLCHSVFPDGGGPTCAIEEENLDTLTVLIRGASKNNGTYCILSETYQPVLTDACYVLEMISEEERVIFTAEQAEKYVQDPSQLFKDYPIVVIRK